VGGVVLLGALYGTCCGLHIRSMLHLAQKWVLSFRVLQS